MKKIIGLLSLVLILAGCSTINEMGNTPTKRVEEYLNNYQTLNSDVLSSLDEIVERETTFSNEQKDTYRELLKKHYQNLTYNIKEETINGDKATVEVEIEVNDYTGALKSAEAYRTDNEDLLTNEKGVFDDIAFNDYKLDLLKNATDKVKYTIYLSATKVNDEWQLDALTNSEEEKLLGIYEY